MRTLFKYLRHYFKSILFILILLSLQAFCELSLPSHTSEIINVGISQGGIKDEVPEVLRRSTVKTLTNYMAKEEKNLFLNCYSFVKNKYELYLEKYPALENQTIYILKEDCDCEVVEIFNRTVMILSAINNDKIADMVTGNDEELVLLLHNFRALPKAEQERLLTVVDEKLEDVPDTFIDSFVATFIRGEYESVGLDLEKIQIEYIIVTGLKMLAVALVAYICAIKVGYTSAKIAAGLAKRLRSSVFNKVLKFSNVEMKKFKVASLITRSTNDITQVQMMIDMIIRAVIFAPIIGFGALFKVMNTNPSMTWIIALAVSLILTIVIVMFIFVMPKFTRLQRLVDKLNLTVREILTGVLPIRAFSNEQYEEERFDEVNKKLKKVSLFVNRAMGCIVPLMMLLVNVIILLIVSNSAKGIDVGTFALGDMMALIQYSVQIIMAFLMVSIVSIMIPKAVVSLKRIDEVLKEEIVIKEKDNPKEFKRSAKGVVEFKNVSFRYPDADYDVISNISFKAEPGTTTAFIGSTGSGKSTLVNLIPRLFNVTDGEILIDGVNIEDVSSEDLHKRIGYVPQQGLLFNGTILENICYGGKINKKQAEKAAQIAQIDNFINQKKDKYNDLITQGDTNVSGEQKQLLSIARTIFKNPDIYIFDDSFSILDFKTDKKLRKALKKEIADKTILVVSECVNTIMHAEKIVVLDEGRIVGIGTHKELMESCQVYQDIVRSQLQEEGLNHG